MTEELLNDSDVVIGLQQVGGEGVPENMGGDFLGDFCLPDGVIERPLQVGFMEMITS